MRISYTIPNEGELRVRRRWVWFLDLAPYGSTGVHGREIRMLEFAWVLERHSEGAWIPSRWLSEQEIAALEQKEQPP